MTDNTPIPIKDVLANPDHPAYADAKAITEKLAKGEINLCACMGPMYGEPHCPCKMTRRGLPPSAERLAAEKASAEKLKELVAAGAFSCKI